MKEKIAITVLTLLCALGVWDSFELAGSQPVVDWAEALFAIAKTGLAGYVAYSLWKKKS